MLRSRLFLLHPTTNKERDEHKDRPYDFSLDEWQTRAALHHEEIYFRIKQKLLTKEDRLARFAAD